jgi:hypothetical protein
LISLVQQNRLLSGGPTSSAAFSRNVSIVLSKTVCWPDGSTGGALIMSGLKKSADTFVHAEAARGYLGLMR